MKSTLLEILEESGYSLILVLKKHNVLEKYVTRLEFLLWGNTDKYTGPLADGFERYEWILVSLLLSDWLAETLVDAQQLTSQMVIDEMRENPDNIATFALELLTKLIERDVIEVKDKQAVLLFLQNEIVVDAVIGHVDEVLDVVSNLLTATCTFCRTNKVKKISERNGLKAYKANKSLLKKSQGKN